MKRILLSLLAFAAFFLAKLSASASASDSINVQHYSIRIDTLDYTAQSIEANTVVSCRSLVNGLNTFTLDLLKLTVDSIQVDGADATWTYNDTLLRVNSPVTFNAGDLFDVQVWYHGVPKKDASSFGGFYFSGTYVYNIGVAFVADPHNFGRVWFPCKDNFTDRATYDFSIRTLDTRLAACSGTLQSQVVNGDGTITWNWSLTDSIPTYLASFAAADYTVIRDTFPSISGDSVPVALYMRPTDSTKVVTQFAKLQLAFDAFEANLGPYRWERVGYVMVPFSGGAMEHATNIAYPTAVLGGGTAWETLWAHELSHNWFGNHVTCESASEMWLNEGFAAYCEALFMEAAYGTTAYKDYVRGNLVDVLRKTHRTDGAYYAVSGVSHDNTYGSTVYDKGATVAHTLRHHMGSSIFFEGIRDYMADHGQGHVHSDSLKESLENSSGTSLDDFFAGWVYTEGFPHFSVDSFQVVPSGGSFDVTVHVRQRMRGRSTLTSSNILEIGFRDGAGNYEVHPLTFSSGTSSATFTLPFSPSVVMADPEEKLADATTDHALKIAGTAAVPVSGTFLDITPISAPDSAWYRVTHHWIAPDPFKTAVNGVRLSDSRHWLIEGIVPSGFLAKATLTFDGRVGTSSSCTSCFLDDSWLTSTEDSLLLFWRADRAADWQLVNGFTVNSAGPITDKKGTITVDTLKLGEYAMGIYDYTVVGVAPAQSGKASVSLAPNPASTKVAVHLSSDAGASITLLDMGGRVISEYGVAKGQRQLTLPTAELAEGMYLVHCRLGSGENVYHRLVIQR